MRELEREKAKEMRNKWENMKLQPQMNVEERGDAYVITSHIPGLNKEQIELGFDEKSRTLTVSSVRVPSEQEENQIRSLIKRNYIDSGQYSAADEELLLLKAAAGRFGKFKESFRLPQNADESKISAKYEGGTFLIIIPKQRRIQRSSFGSTPFFNDPDVWWR